MSIADRARDLAGYDEVSRLRQAQDLDWVLDLVGGAPRSLADLGCGTGALLDAALDRWPGLEHVLGVDGAPGRVATARRRLGAAAEIRRDDLLKLPDLPAPVDVVTCTSVLHWLHPRERRLFAWVARHLRPDGTFVLTTHHPHLDGSGLGAEDLVAAEALAALGRPGLAAIVPMSVRARRPRDVHLALLEHLHVDAIEERYAGVGADSAREYAAFHASTFGTTYSRLVPEDEQEDFFTAVGEAAWRRIEAHGQVYTITVRAWRARPR